MLIPSLNIGEVMEFQKGISVKRKLDSAVWNCVGIALFRPFKQIPPNIQNFVALHTCRTSCEEHVLFSKCGLNRLQLILKKFVLTLMVHNAQE
jgi:hypothetical protein